MKNYLSIKQHSIELHFTPIESTHYASFSIADSRSLFKQKATVNHTLNMIPSTAWKTIETERIAVMKKMIAFCGVECYECPTFKATQKDDNQKRMKIAELWSREYKIELKPEDINCDGCLTNSGRLFNHCKVCYIRKCCQEKQIENCAYCHAFVCQELDYIFKAIPKAKTTLEKIRKNKFSRAEIDKENSSRA